MSNIARVGAVRNDSVIENLAIGLGDPSADKSMHFNVVQPRMLTKRSLESLYQGNWICQNCIDIYPSEATRKWAEIKLGGDTSDKKKIDQFVKYQDRLGVVKAFATADRWARLYGGAAIVIIAEDGQPSDRPMNLTNIRTIRKLKVLDRYRVRPYLAGMEIEEPEFYELMLPPSMMKDFESMLGKSKGMSMRIHKSRVLRFDGVEMPPDILMYNEGWGTPILNLLYDTFARFEGMDASVTNLVSEASIFIYKMKGLAELLSRTDDEGLDILTTRLRAIKRAKSSLNMMIADADQETIEQISRTFAGLPDLLDKMMVRMTGASRMPMTILFGQGPGGLTAQGAGDAEEKTWAKLVEQHQVDRYSPLLRSPDHSQGCGLFEMIWLAKDGPSKGKIPDDWSFEWRSLIVQTEEQKLAQREKQSNVDKTYVDMKVLLPEEVRESRFRGAEYSLETVLNEKLWQEKQEEDPFAQFNDFGGDGGQEEEDPNAPTEAPPEEEDPNAPTEAPPEEEPARQDANDRPQLVTDWHGLSLGITHKPGDMRHGRPMLCHYAHIRGSYGHALDGMAHDAYVDMDGGDRIFKVRQLKDDGTVDELKWILGCSSIELARDLYLRHMPRQYFGGIEEAEPGELNQYRKDCACEDKPRNRKKKQHLPGSVRSLESIDGEVDRIDGGANATSERDAADAITDQTMAAAGSEVQNWMAIIGDWLEQQHQDGADLADVRENIYTLHGQLPGDAFAEHLTQANILAHLVGQDEVRSEVEP